MQNFKCSITKKLIKKSIFTIISKEVAIRKVEKIKWLSNISDRLRSSHIIPRFTTRGCRKWNKIFSNAIKFLTQKNPEHNYKKKFPYLSITNGCLFLGGSRHVFTFLTPSDYKRIRPPINKVFDEIGEGYPICFFQRDSLSWVEWSKSGGYLQMDEDMIRNVCRVSNCYLFEMENSNFRTCLPCLFREMEDLQKCGVLWDEIDWLIPMKLPNWLIKLTISKPGG